MHCSKQPASSVRHCVAPNWVPLSLRCLFPPHPTFHCHPGQPGSALPVPVINGKQGPGLTFHTCIPALGSWSQLCLALSPASPAKMGLHGFKSYSKQVFLKPIPTFLSTFASMPLVQGLSLWTHPSPGSALSNLMETTATCNLFQGWSVHCSPLFKCPQ